MGFKETFMTGITGTKQDNVFSELDNELQELEQKKQNVIYQFGLEFYRRNKEKNYQDEFVQNFVRDVNEIEQQYNMLNKKKLYIHGMRACDKCQAVLPADSLFCNKCGSKLEELAEKIVGCICKNCGNRLEEDAMFCPNCGTKVDKKEHTENGCA